MDMEKNEIAKSKIRAEAATARCLQLYRERNALAKAYAEREKEVEDLVDTLKEVSECCDAWLSSEIQEPAVDFLKGIKIYINKKLELWDGTKYQAGL